jgi:hypothetical protein
MLAKSVKGDHDARNALEVINEIVVLCRKLLTSDTSRVHLISALTQAVLDLFARFLSSSSPSRQPSRRSLPNALHRR